MNWFRRLKKKKLICVNCNQVFKGKVLHRAVCPWCETQTSIIFRPHHIVKSKNKYFLPYCKNCHETTRELEEEYGKDWKNLDHCSGSLEFKE